MDRRLSLRAASIATLLMLAACGGGEIDKGADNADTQTAQNPPTREEAQAIAGAELARWTPLQTTPIVPISVANLPNGKLLLWSAENRFGFGSDLGRTYTVLYDTATGTMTERLVNETGHDMFCPGTSNLPDGRILVNGGLSSGKTSIYDGSTNSWTTAAAMNIPRAYQGNTTLADGSVLTLGGSWAGGVGNKHGEVWTEATGWKRLPGVPIDAMLSTDPSRNFGMDSHLWLIPTGNGRVLHAGPGVNMNWIATQGDGRVSPAGPRGDDEFSISGNTVMYDTGKVLKTGGGPGYDSVNANANSYVIDTASGGVAVRRIANMAYRRAFHNSVVLPNGQVVIVGGQTYAVGFSDANSVLVPELFDPVSETFTPMAPMAAPRNYHSIAILLPDARVMSAGGGLCGDGCAANHPDLQILSPPYLFNADGSTATRPAILSAPAQAGYGTAMAVATDTAVSSFALVRLSSTTHTVNNDQRRLSLGFRATGTNTYAVDVPSNPGWAVPGHYMLFAMNANGTPSVAATVRISGNAGPRLTPPDEQVSTLGATVSYGVQALPGNGGTLSYSATGLPDGLGIDAGTGRIAGVPTRSGSFVATVAVTDGVQTLSSLVPWVVNEPGNIRHVRLETVSEVAGNPWASMAEFNLLDDAGQVIPRTGWTASVDSAELAGENGAAANALDGNPATIWHTQWQGASPTHPHWFAVNLGSAQKIGGFRYLPRAGGGNGTVAGYRFYVSADGINWGSPVASGDLRALGANAAEKTVYLGNLAQGRTATQSSSLDANSGAFRAVDGGTDGVYANGSVTHTLNEATPWWDVDLGGATTLHTVRLWNRSDCCADRLANFQVLLSPTPMAGRTLAGLLADPAVRQVAVPGTAGAVTTLALSGTGRYLRVQLSGTNFLSLAEVQAYGRPAVNQPPTLAAPTPPSSTAGVATTLQLSASDPDGDALAWSATGLPPGLTLGAGNGLVSGTPTTTGSFSVQATVADGRGGSASTAFTWTVVPPTPVIAPLAAPAVVGGGTASYTVNAGGGSYTYSWDYGDGSAPTAFETSPSTTHSYATPGVYSVTVSVKTAQGDVTTRSFLQAVLTSAVTGRAPASGKLAHELRNGANARLWTVNADNDSVSVFDAVMHTRLAEVAVGTQPRSLAIAPNGRIWVVNRGAASLSLIDPVSLAVAQTVALPTGSQPYGIVVGSDGSAYVALEATGRVLKLNAAGSTLADVAVPGARHLALSRDGSRLLVARFVTAPQPGEATTTVQTAINGVNTGGELVELDPATLAQRRRFVLQHSQKPDTTVSARGVPNYLGAPAIAPDGNSAWVPSKQDNIQRGVRRDGQDLDFQDTVRAISSRIDLVAQAEDHPARIDHDNAGLASAAVYHPNGAYVFVALETSRQVAVLDAAGRRELFRIEVGRAPQALAVSPDGLRLYVDNFMDRTLAVHDLSALVNSGDATVPRLALLASVATEKLSATVLKGKQFFYDARDVRLARDAYLSCAACHNDGGQDGRVWDLSGAGEGLRNTISLRGRAGGQGRLHWSGNFDEVQDFEAQIRTLAAGTGLMSDALFNTGTRNQPLGTAKAGVSADLDALAAYVASLQTSDPTPWRNSNGTLSTPASNGRAVFAAQCAGCHSGTPYTDSAGNLLRDVGTLKPGSGTRLGAALTGIDTPTLRDAWASAPYLHDGSAATLEAAILAHSTLGVTAADATLLGAFVRQIGSQEAAVAAATGLRGDYFAGTALAGAPLLIRNEAVDFDWGTAAAGTGVPADAFSVRWTGVLLPTSSGSHRFQTVSDDGVRVYVNNQLVIDNWTQHSATTNTSGNVTLTAGQRVPIRVEYFDQSGGSTMRLRWRLPNTSSYVAIPAARLAPK